MKHEIEIKSVAGKQTGAVRFASLPSSREVAALVPQREIDVQLGDINSDMQSTIMTQALRKIHYSLCQSQTLIIFVNQVRSKPRAGKGFGHAEEVTCGGNSLPFYAALRLRISRTGLLKTEDEVTGLGISVKVVKNKLAPPLKIAKLGIKFGKGISCESEVLDLAWARDCHQRRSQFLHRKECFEK